MACKTACCLRLAIVNGRLLSYMDCWCEPMQFFWSVHTSQSASVKDKAWCLVAGETVSHTYSFRCYHWYFQLWKWLLPLTSRRLVFLDARLIQMDHFRHYKIVAWRALLSRNLQRAREQNATIQNMSDSPFPPTPIKYKMFTALKI